MNQEAYFKLHQRICDEARELSKLKNNDYASPDNRQDDPFAIWANFMQCEHLNVCSVEQGFCVRLSDKFSRLCNLLRPGHKSGVMDEKLDDTVKDIINYTILLLGYLETKRKQGPHWADGFPEPLVETDIEVPGWAPISVKNPAPPVGCVYNETPVVAQAKLHEHRFISDESAKKEIRKHEEMKAEALHRDTWYWFLQLLRLRPELDLPSAVARFKSWQQRKEEHDVSFVCPKCLSRYWGTVGVPGEPVGCTGHCHGFAHGDTMPNGEDCRFVWDRETEDKFVGLGKKPGSESCKS